MNGATEATLQELLLIARQMNVNLEKFTSSIGSGSSGGGSTGGGLGGLASVAKFAGPAGMALGALSTAASLVGAVFETIGNIVGKVVTGLVDTVKNLFEFAKSAAMGTAKLSDLYDAFKDLPFFIGTVAHIFADIIRYSEQLLVTYQQLTKVGAGFSGDLFKMREAAARSGLSMQEFADVISNNSQVFASMGLSVQAGIDKFTQASGALIGPGSKFSKDLLGLGYTARDIADGLTTVLARETASGLKNGLTADQLADRTKNYLTELDELAKVTGKSREEQDKKNKELANDQSFQIFRAQLSEGSKATLDSLTTLGSALGPGVEEAIKGGAQGLIAPMTDAGIDFQTTSRGMYTEIATTVRNLIQSGVPIDQARQIINEKLTKAGRNMAEFSGGLNDQTRALTANMLNSNSEMARIGIIMKRDNVTFEEALRRARDLQKDQAKGNAGSLATAEQNIRNFGNVIMGFVSQILSPVTNVLADWGKRITEWMTDGAGKLTEKFQGVVDWFQKNLEPAIKEVEKWFIETFEYLTKNDNKSFWTKLGEKVSEGLSIIWKTLEPAFQVMWDKVEPVIERAFSLMIDKMWEIIKDKLNPLSDSQNTKDWKKATEDTLKRSDELGKSFKQFLDQQKQQAVEFAGPDGIPYIKDDYQYLQDFQKGEGKKFYPSLNQTAPEGKATGGPIRAGQYLVGEKGPELINTASSGNVITNDNINALMARASESDKTLTRLMEMLNIQNRQIVSLMSEMTDYTKRNNDALQDIAGDAFA